MKPPSLAALALAVVCSPATAEHFVDYDNPLIPTGLRPGDSFHLVFATSGTTHRDRPLLHTDHCSLITRHFYH